MPGELTPQRGEKEGNPLHRATGEKRGDLNGAELSPIFTQNERSA